ncbi:MAG: tetratricopeptide repeat protein [Verrucomicrobiota bacterium]
MEPNHDIYRKEDLPFLLRRRKNRRDSRGAGSQNTNGSPGQTPGAPGQPGGTPPPVGSRHDSSARRHRRHRHHAYGQDNSGGKLLWIALAAVLALYALVLVASVLRSSKRVREEPVQGEPGGPVLTNTASAQAVADMARKVQERIAAWNRLPDAIVEAQTLQDQGFLDQAEQRLMIALEATPHAATLQFRLARVHMQQKKFGQARDVLLQLLESNPDDVSARLMLASAFENQTNYPAALAVAKWVLETDPNRLEAHEIAANAYLNTDRRGLAITHLRKMVALDRENAATQNKLALAYTQIGEYVKAIQLFNEVLTRNATDSVTYYNLAVCYARQSMTEQVVETLSRAIGVFGQDFVSTWTEGKDFDSVRTDPLFVAFLGEAGKKARPATAAPRPAEQPPPTGPATNPMPASGPPS